MDKTLPNFLSLKAESEYLVVELRAINGSVLRVSGDLRVEVDGRSSGETKTD